MSKFNDLIQQIEQFIRKYYKNEMLKGVFLFLSIFLVTFLLVSVLEYFGRFGQTVRLFLFYTFIVGNVYVLTKYIIIPLFKLNKLGNRLSLNQASKLIGSIFPDVSDKLQNTLQLNAQLDLETRNVELIRASIDQRASRLSVIPFSSGIDLRENMKYLKYFFPILIIVFLVAMIRPTIFSDGSKRIINYNMEFVEEAPFDFILVGTDSVLQGDSYDLKIRLEGSDIPNEVKINSNKGVYNLEKKSAVEFVHHFANIDEDITFQCEANGFTSKTFNINVLQKPVIENLKLKLKYPKHTGMSDEEVYDLSDMSIPDGTLLEWVIKSDNASRIDVKFNDTLMTTVPNSNSEFRFKRSFRESTPYHFLLSTSKIEHADSVQSRLTIIPDAFPKIAVTEEKDSLNPLVYYFNGTVSDDYGFSGLKMVAKVIRDDSTYKVVERIDINKRNTKQIFSHFLDFSKYNLKPGDQLEYYFTVTDNDVLNGYKSSTSTRQVFAVPELDELDDLLSEKNDELKKDMDKALSDSKKLKESISEIKNELINKKAPDWKDKQSIENMLRQQENLQQQLDQLQEKFEENNIEENEFLENPEELLEKQELLEKLMEELMDEELKELLEELQKLMDEMNKDELLENMEKMENKSESLEKELDRTLELFKHLELDKKIENIEEQLRELSEEQEALKELTEDKELSPEELKEKQDELNEKFEEIKEDIKDAEEMNNNLEEPQDLDFNKEDEQSISDEMKESSESLSDGKEKKASESQSKAAEMMEQMADDIQAMQQSASMQQDSEDMDKLRFLLENIVILSHEQEGLLVDYGEINNRNPIIVEYNREQVKLGASSEIIRDSLEALAKRQGQLSNTILDELANLDYNMGKSVEYGEERNVGKIKQHQQYSVTSLNDLALLLSDVLEQMQQQMQAQMSGKGSCNKPGGSGSGKPSNKMSMQQMKDQLKKQMSKMQNGSNPGGKKGQKPGEGMGMGQPGGNNGQIPGLSSKEIAKMALEQGQMRRALQQLRQELNKDGSGLGNELNKLINDMEKLENDLLNNGYSNDMLKRQQDIMTRLLESEKAILERGYSEERESNSAKNAEEGNQIKLIEYNIKKENEIELLRSVPIGLRFYYKTLINDYFNTVNK